MSRADIIDRARGSRITDAALSTAGLEVVRRRRGPDGLLDREAAEAWAAEQGWTDRVVRRGCDARFFIWWIKPAGGRA